MRRTRSTLLALISFLLPGVLFAATRPHYGGVLRLQVNAQLSSLENPEPNPSWSQSALRAQMLRLVYERLTSVDDAGRVLPMLATNWEHAPDYKRWTFTLRKSVELHDGSILTAPDVVRALAPNGKWRVSSSGEAIIVESDAPLPQLPEILASTRNSIIVRRAATPVGSGPFRVDVWQPGKFGTFVAHDQHWQGRPFLDAIELQMGFPLPELLLQLESRKADIAEVGIADMRRLQQSGVSVAFSAPQDLYALVLNSAISKDSRLRDALSASIDRAAIENIFLQKHGAAAAALVPQWITGYAALFPAARDLERAQQLRRDLGSLPPMNLSYDGTDLLARTIAERLALNTRDAGITLRTVPADPLSQNAELKLVRIPLSSANAVLDLDELAARFGSSLLLNKEVSDDQLFRAEGDLLSAQPVIPLAHIQRAVGIAPRVHNWTTSRDGVWRLEDLWIEGR